MSKKVQTNHFESLNVFSVLQESFVLPEDVLRLKKPWNLDLLGMLRNEIVYNNCFQGSDPLCS